MGDRAAAGAGLVFLCNPNNPTGAVHGAAKIADFGARVVTASPETRILVAESHANFVLVNIRRDAEQFAKECLAQGIAVGRPFPPLTDWSRITIGTEHEIRRAIAIFRKVLSA